MIVVIFAAFAVCAFVLAAMGVAGSVSAFHETEALILALIGAVFAVGAAVVHAIASLPRIQADFDEEVDALNRRSMARAEARAMRRKGSPAA